MIYVCLWSRAWSTGAAPGPELLAALLESAPRVAAGAGGIIWVEGPVRLARGGSRRASGAVRGRVAGGAAGAGPVAASRTDQGSRPRPDHALRAGALLARTLLDRLAAAGVEARAGVAAVPVAAEAAARVATVEQPVTTVDPGGEHAFLAPLPLGLLCADDRILELLEGVGMDTCGALAAVPREAVEVRFGAGAVALWRLARADDPRRPFRPIPPERPHASLEFGDYVLTDPARLVFTANALLGSVCEALARRGEHARRVALVLELANGGSWRRALRAARPTASRETWLRLIRGVLDRITVPDAVAGMRLEVEATEPASVRQGDLFDAGFETAAAVEAAVARLVEAHGQVVVAPETCAHPLAERRTRWRPRSADQVAGGGQTANGARGGGSARSDRKAGTAAAELENAARPGVGGTAVAPGATDPVPALTLQLLPEPRRVPVRTVPRRDHDAPSAYRPHGRSGWIRLAAAAGPDRVSGGVWDEPFAREYFRCVSEDGALLWLYRDARGDGWYLHGWWD